MKQIKLLAVGNSFTQDALYYLHDICAAGGIDCRAANLYIGGCSLERHWENIQSGEKAYLLEENGRTTERYVASEEILKSEEWDFIFTQQASHDSGIRDTYFPYIRLLAEHFRRICPQAKMLIQKTWAYEIDSDHPEFKRYHNSQQEMYDRLTGCYAEAASAIGAYLIPSADVIQDVRKKAPFRYELGEKSLCRDGYHMDMVYGRYLLGALFYMYLTGRDIRDNSFRPENADENALEVIRQSVASFA